MERRAAGSEEENDGGKAGPCRVQAGAAASSHCEKSTGGGSEGEEWVWWHRNIAFKKNNHKTGIFSVIVTGVPNVARHDRI